MAKAADENAIVHRGDEGRLRRLHMSGSPAAQALRGTVAAVLGAFFAYSALTSNWTLLVINLLNMCCMFYTLDRYVKTTRTTLEIRITAPPEGSEKSTFIHLKGTLNVHTGPALKRSIIDQVKKAPRHLIVNMSAVDAIDHGGLENLIHGQQCVRKHNGTLSIVSPSKVVSELLDDERLRGLYDVYTGEPEALPAKSTPSGS